MKSSIVNTFIIVYMLISLLMGGFITLFLTANQVDLILEKTVNDTSRRGLIVREWVQKKLSEGVTPETLQPQDFIKDHRDIPIQEIVITDEFGLILSVDQTAESSNISEKRLKEIHIAMTRRAFQGKLFHFEINRRQRTLVTYVPLESSERTVIVIATLYLEDLDRSMNRLTFQTGIVLIGIFLLLSALTFYTWNQVVKPILQMKKAVGKISRGQFEVELNLRRSDEMGDLSRSIAQMAYAVQDMETHARSVNPLSGLPGNTRIEYWIREKLQGDDPFCIIYADLDSFKPYNDIYGFSKGDEILLFTARLIQQAVLENATDLSFVGHQGGDDFIATCPHHQWESICKKITADFDAGVRQFYNEEHCEKGHIVADNRKGEQTTYELSSISLAVVSNLKRKFSTYAEMASVASEVKKYVKTMKGSSYHIDKRSGK